MSKPKLREAARRLLEWLDYMQKTPCWSPAEAEDQRNEKKSRIDALAAALEQEESYYAQHEPPCPRSMHDSESTGGLCTCGVDAALAKLAAVRALCHSTMDKEHCPGIDDGSEPYLVGRADAFSEVLATLDSTPRHPAEDEVDKLTATIASLRAKICDGGHWHTDELLEVLDGARGDVECVRVPVGPGGAIDEKHVDAALQNLDAPEGVILLVPVPR